MNRRFERPDGEAEGCRGFGAERVDDRDASAFGGHRDGRRGEFDLRVHLPPRARVGERLGEAVEGHVLAEEGDERHA